jgi:adenylyltransferase/sulfurtransferase
VDGTDNFPTRYLANDACVLLRKPNVYGSILRWEGQASLFAPHLGGPCYRCLYPEPPPPGAVPSCAEAGVMGVVPGVIGCLQATEAVKLILGAGDSLLGRLLVFDALAARFRELRVRRDPACPVCGDCPTIRELADYEALCGCTAGATVDAPGPDEVSLEDMEHALRDPALGVTVVDVREPAEWALGRIDGTLLLAGSELPARAAELDPARSYYLHCQSGVRSLRAVALLKARGFQSVRSVHGGYAAWCRRSVAGS